jgi:hypothetical protein
MQCAFWFPWCDARYDIYIKMSGGYIPPCIITADGEYIPSCIITADGGYIPPCSQCFLLSFLFTVHKWCYYHEY